MYELQREIALVKGSASAFCKNLSTVYVAWKGLTYGAIVDRDQVHTVSWDQKVEGMTHDTIAAKDLSQRMGGLSKRVNVMQAKYCSPIGRSSPVLVVCTTAGTMANFWAYMKGIGCINDTIVVGSHTGAIYTLCVRSDGIVEHEPIEETKEAVVDLDASRTHVVYGSVKGTMMVFNQEMKLRKKFETGYNISAVAADEDFMYCATAHGQLIVYGAFNGEKLVEICAHARPITTLHVARSGRKVLTGSEDSFVRLWTVDNGPTPKVSCTFSSSIENVPIVGGCFVSSSGTTFALVGYDFSSILVFRQEKRNSIDK